MHPEAKNGDRKSDRNNCELKKTDRFTKATARASDGASTSRNAAARSHKSCWNHGPRVTAPALSVAGAVIPMHQPGATVTGANINAPSDRPFLAADHAGIASQSCDYGRGGSGLKVLCGAAS